MTVTIYKQNLSSGDAAAKWGKAVMLKLVAVIIAGGFLSGLVPMAAQAANEPDKAAVQKATADCRAQVKEQARFHEMSWYARHKAVRECVKNGLAKH